MSIGQMRTRLYLESSTETRTSDGGVVEAWTPDTPIWARVRGLRGRELFSAQQINPQTSHKLTIRYCKGLTSGNHLLNKDGARIFNIQSVIDIDERHREMELLCTEVAG